MWQNIIEGNIKYLTKLPAAIVTLGIAYVLLRVARKVLTTAMNVARVDKAIQSMVLSAVNFAGWIFALAAALSVMELNQLSLALGGSVALIAMALATGLNGVTQDLMAGMFLISDDDFTVGRRVKAAGVEGRLEALTIRKTKIRDDNGQVHTIPNRNVDGATYTIIPDHPEEEAEQKVG